MSIQIDVPEIISRSKYLALIEALGFDPDTLISLELGMNALSAVVFALDADGKRYANALNENQIATHRITIPVVDDADVQDTVPA